MTLEYQLNKQCQNKEPLNQILPRIRSELEKQRDLNEEIAGPFSYAVITGKGFDDRSDEF